MSNTTINIHAPVYGTVAGRDAAAACTLTPHDEGWNDVATEDLVAAIAGVRADLRRHNIAYWTSGPCLAAYACFAVVVTGTLSVLLGRGFGAPIGVLMTLLLLSTVPISYVLWRVEQKKVMVRYVIADLMRELRTLERVLALRQAGRL